MEIADQLCRDTVIEGDNLFDVVRIRTFDTSIMNKMKKIGINPLTMLPNGETIYELNSACISYRNSHK